MSPPVFLAEHDQLAADHVVLGGSEGRHAAAVRRIRAGERVDLTDGAGLRAECVVVASGRDHLELEVTARHQEPVPEPRIVAVQALPKGDRGELAVELMTEVGVDRIVPWAASRCVTQWRGARQEKALARWRSAAREAAKQARRAWVPEVAELVTTAQASALIGASARAVILDEAATSPLTGVDLPRSGDLVVVVGPEGGLSAEEFTEFAHAGGQPVRLGPAVMRTSSAGMAAAAVLLSRCGRW